MKKIGIVFVVLVALIGIYYFTIGSTQIVTEIKKEINQEVTTLKSSGFVVEERDIKEKSEHFVIDFNDTKSITHYLKKSNSTISEEELALLKGLKVGIDIEYTPTVKDAISFDIYPLKLPIIFYQELKDDNKTVKAIEKRLKEKLVVVHLNVDKLLSGFDGYLKDIDTKFNDNDKNGHFITKGFSFYGDIKDNDIKNLHQNIKEFSLEVEKEIKLVLSNMKFFIQNPTDAKYSNNSSNYTLESFTLNQENNESSFLTIKNLSGSSKDSKKGEFIDGVAQFKIASIDYSANNQKVLFENLNTAINIKNVDINSIQELEKLSEDENVSLKEIIPLLKKFTKSDISFNISNLSLESITTNGNKIDGFSINAQAKSNKNFDWNGVELNPMKLMSLGDIKANISISNGLFSLIAQDPKMMMVMMITQPVDKNGTKVYDLEFNKGSLKVNGKPFM